ncbi:class I SAM-dependent methyltransferase [Govanella unica]|uniref:Class I SAM-dependent methyltransferase n=1 Tax=Govanella unica TaxID=2975056 RepID=A0A9X3TWC4_9PROT|nr:class I SAM-dependent methyltransferase [Govania unica]MDA5192912.1 class I SAM-dependent methyltransferase [Govania unica]
MVYHLQHEMLPQQTGDEIARAHYVLSLKRFLMRNVRPANVPAYENEGKDLFIAKHGRAPQSRAEVAEAMMLTPHFQMWSSLNRSSQQLMWRTVGESIYRDLDRMEAASERLINAADKKGSLDLDPTFDAHAQYPMHHIHLQPEGYLAEDDGKSVTSGAFYEAGGRIYSMGRGMEAGDSKAGAVIAFLRQLRPDFKPTRILDMGCSAGGASTSYPEAFPDAEVHAIDLGSSMLRYAHARAESMGAPVHFHQMDAGKTRFPDGHFDLIVSHNMLHEISDAKRQEMARETLRLLAPGGIALHQDVDILNRGRTVAEEAERGWDLNYNNEPYWEMYADCDLRSELIAAGFPEDMAQERRIPKTDGPGFWYAWTAEKA